MKSIYKTIIGTLAVAVTLAGVMTPAFVNAKSDNWCSGTYTVEEINELFGKGGKCEKEIIFNSIVDPNNDKLKIKNETNFVAAKVADASVKTWNADTINVEAGKTYTIRLYVHNNNPNGLDAIAEKVKARFEIPTPQKPAKTHTITGYLGSSASSRQYGDEVKLESNEYVYLEYVENSAIYSNNKGTFKLSNDAITSGVTLGYEEMDGNIPGCYEYSGELTIKVKVHKLKSLVKQVRIAGTNDDFSDQVKAKEGQEVEYRIRYVNVLDDEVEKVTIIDSLPTNVEYVENSTRIVNSNYQDGVSLKDSSVRNKDGGLTIGIGDYASLGGAFVYFKGKVVDKTLACGKNQLVNWAGTTVNGKKYEGEASVMVDKVCKEEPKEDPEPNPTPTPTPTPTSEPTPTTIVETGAGTIVMGAVGAGSVVTMLGYYIASRKKLM